MPKMRAVQVTSARAQFNLVEREIPEPAPRQVRVKVEACGVCHSDFLTKEGLWPGIQYPRVQFASRMAFRTVAIARGQDKAALARELGAQLYIDSTKENVAERLQQLGGAKIILATASSGEAMTAALDGLGVDGKLIVLGA